MKWALAAPLAWAAFVATASAQSAATTPAPAPSDASSAPQPAAAVSPGVAPTDGLRLAMDTLVRIELGEAVSSKDRKRGDKFAIRLASAIIVDGREVAPAGATGQGEVVYAEKGGGGGSPGKLVLAARYVDVPGGRIKLKAFNLAAGGESEFREMQVAAEFVGPVVLFLNGHDVLYPVGTRARAKIAEDIVLPPGPAAPVPPAPAAAMPAQTTSPTSSAPPASSTVPAQETSK
jgi:hypothetical protein